MAATVRFPTTDSGLFQWSVNFSTKITATPTAYGLVAGQASAYASVHAAFGAALAAADPAVRNKPATLEKNQARTDLKTAARSLAMIIQGTPIVTDAQRAELGLTVPATPSPIPPPAAAPQVDVVSVVGRLVKIRIHDAAGEGKRPRPAGVKAAVCSYVGPVPPSDPAAYKWEGNTTRTIAEILFPESCEPGTVVWLTAMWMNERQQRGPACPPVSATIQFGMSAAA